MATTKRRERDGSLKSKIVLIPIEATYRFATDDHDCKHIQRRPLKLNFVCALHEKRYFCYVINSAARAKNPRLRWDEAQYDFLYSPTTVGSKSTNTARGTCFPAPVSLKNVLNESSPPPIVLSLGIWPSGWMPCSKQYNSQQAFPIWTPAWPTWTEIHSR